MSALTIEELAACTGMTVRNIRAYQAKHLLHSPTLEGRLGMYDDSHVERIELIRRLQEEGFNLDAARILIQQGESFGAEVERLRNDLAQEAGDEPAWIPMTESGLAIARENGPETLNKLVEAEILRRDEEGQMWVRPAFQIGWRLFELGLPHSSLYDLLFAVDRHVRPLGRVYADQVERHLLSGTRDRANVETVPDLAKIREQYEELTSVVAQLMSAAFEVAVRRELRRALEARLRGRRPAPRR
jgi:DNA-binding transcriptional MerR regulator